MTIMVTTKEFTTIDEIVPAGVIARLQPREADSGQYAVPRAYKAIWRE